MSKMIDKQQLALHEKDIKKLTERLREYSRQIHNPRFSDDLNMAAELIDPPVWVKEDTTNESDR